MMGSHAILIGVLLLCALFVGVIVNLIMNFVKRIKLERIIMERKKEWDYYQSMNIHEKLAYIRWQEDEKRKESEIKQWKSVV